MKFVSISDVHIKSPGDKAERLFFRFLESEEVKGAEYIFLLGDIFDLLVGTGYEVETRYAELFLKLRRLLENGKQIIQYEGNHDFHFPNLIKKCCQRWGIESRNWQYLNRPKVFHINDRKILFCHGDEIELGNYSYKFYRFWIRSQLIYVLANYIIPGKWVQKIGDNASKKSRKRNNDRYNQNEMDEYVRRKFRKSAQFAANTYGISIVICGHSHCMDQYKSDEFEYYNNGYFPVSRSFIVGSEAGITIITLPIVE